MPASLAAWCRLGAEERTSAAAAAIATAAIATAAIAMTAASFLVAPAALSYDPEAWLVWGRELAAARLDVTAGPAIKPLPIGLNALTAGVAGSDAAWAGWAAVSRAALLLAAALGATVAAGGISAARRSWWLAGAAAVVATPTLLEGALAGGSEAMVAAALLGACLLGASDRLVAALAVLAAAALLRPEALLLAAAVWTLWVWQRRPPVLRAAAMVAVGGAVPALWIGLQWAGGGDLAGGAAAAAALREGQPGLAPRPALATLGAAAFAVPALVAAGVAAWWASRARVKAQPFDPAVPQWAVGPFRLVARGPARWALGLGGLWVATVALMAELGFSGEARYLAPGLTLLLVGALGVIAVALSLTATGATLPASVAAGPPIRRRAGADRTAMAALATIGVAGVAAAAQAVPAMRDHHALVRSQHDLSVLLDRPEVRADAASCATVAVPRFMRPAVAWRLNRAVGSLQSPRTEGAECILHRGANGAGPVQDQGGRGRAIQATSGTWFWRRTAPETPPN